MIPSSSDGSGQKAKNSKSLRTSKYLEPLKRRKSYNARNSGVVFTRVGLDSVER